MQGQAGMWHTTHILSLFVHTEQPKTAVLHKSGGLVQESFVGRADGGGPEKRTARLDQPGGVPAKVPCTGS